MSHRGSELELKLPHSERELRMLRAYAKTGLVKEACREMGVRYSTGKNLLSHAYARLGVFGAVNAFRKLGWLRVPDEPSADT